MKQTFVFTALPNGIIERNGNKYLQLSAFVSVRLEDPSEKVLGDFPDMLDWPGKLKDASYIIRIGAGNEQEVDLLDSKLDSDLWEKLFHENILVKKFEQEDLTNHRIHSYPVKHVHDFVVNAYKRVAIESPDRLMHPDELIDPKRFGAISKFRIRDYSNLEQQASSGRLKGEVTEKELIQDNRDMKRRFDAMLRQNKYIPFQKTPDPEMDFIQFRDFHKTERGLRTTPLKKLKKPEFEFHDIVSIIGSYPQVQRKLGFILDFELPIPNALPASDVVRIIPQDMEFDVPTEISAPATAFRYTGDGFYVAHKDDSPYRYGFVEINTPDYTVYQVDTDGSGIKTNNMADNKIQEKVRKVTVRINLLRSRKYTTETLKEEETDKEGVPTMRSAGIAIARNGTGERLFTRFQVSKQLPSKMLSVAFKDPDLKVILPNDVLTSDDVTQGFRMDVAYSNEPDKWYSLHFRQDRYYYVDNDLNEIPIEDIEPDEGFTQTAVTEDTENTEDLYAAETFLRWEGWSLSVRKPGYAINEADPDSPDESKHKDYVSKDRATEDKKYAFDPTREFRMLAQSELVNGTLPRLRFGGRYNLRVRTVDLAGNSVPLEAQPEKPNKAIIPKFRYLRFDALGNPIVLLATPLKDGESTEHMVIRSNYDMTTAQFNNTYPAPGDPVEDEAIRHYIPPKNSQIIAEYHRKFDKALGNNPAIAMEMYQLITSRDDLLEPGNDDMEKVYDQDNVDLVYLPDPMAAGVAFFLADGYDNTHTQEFRPRLFGFFQNAEVPPSDTNVNIPEDKWYDAKSLRIHLKEGNLDAQWNPSDRMLTVSMPKGQRMVLKYSSFWREKDLEELSGMWDMVKKENPGNIKDLRQLAYTGRHWMISSPREIELVHAVQQPVEEPQIKKIIPSRDYDATFSYLNTLFSVHGYSTEKIDCFAKWVDPIDNLTNPEPEEKDGSGMIPDITINYHDKEKQRGIIPKDKPLDIKKPDDKKPKLKQLKKKPTLIQASLATPPLKHEFGDTKHRWVDYQPAGVTRYEEYFETLTDGEGEKLPFTRYGAWKEKVNILSSARPAVPEIDYIIPTFEWRKSQDGNAYRHERLGGGLRIYLKRPWYSSGADEKLGIVLMPSGSGKRLGIMVPGGGNFNTNVTQWAIDPAFPSPKMQTTGPRPHHFRYDPVVDNVSFPTIPGAKVDIVGYPVEFDVERGLWYADIALNFGNTYNPFIKLALARYQEHSVRKDDKDVCLSPVVYPDFVQLVPHRKATLRFKKAEKNTVFNLTIEGNTALPQDRVYLNYFEVIFLDPELAQPFFGVVDNDENDRAMARQKARFNLSSKNVKNSYFTINSDFRLPSKYKTAPFEIIIKEYQGVPVKPKGVKPFRNEVQPALVYADVFKINAKGKDFKIGY